MGARLPRLGAALLLACKVREHVQDLEDAQEVWMDLCHLSHHAGAPLCPGIATVPWWNRGGSWRGCLSAGQSEGWHPGRAVSLSFPCLLSCPLESHISGAGGRKGWHGLMRASSLHQCFHEPLSIIAKVSSDRSDFWTTSNGKSLSVSFSAK